MVYAFYNSESEILPRMSSLHVINRLEWNSTELQIDYIAYLGTVSPCFIIVN